MSAARLTNVKSFQFTELHAAALPGGRAAIADAAACAGTGAPAANASATNPCALLTVTPSCEAQGGPCRSDSGLVLATGGSRSLALLLLLAY